MLEKIAREIKEVIVYDTQEYSDAGEVNTAKLETVLTRLKAIVEELKPKKESMT